MILRCAENLVDDRKFAKNLKHYVVFESSLRVGIAAGAVES